MAEGLGSDEVNRASLNKEINSEARDTYSRFGDDAPN